MEAEHTQLAQEFEEGWKNFLNCIDFGQSFLNAEAICFMNEMPHRIAKTCNSHDALVKTCKAAQELIKFAYATPKEQQPHKKQIAEIEAVIAKAEKG